MISHNTSPFFDDFDPAKGYHKIMFVPGNPVQARELTQIQSILQNQIKMHGDHVFKNGTMVIPGNFYHDSNVIALKLNPEYEGVSVDSVISNMVDSEIIGQTNKISARVIHYQVSTPTTNAYLFIKYTSAAGNISEFVTNEVLFESTSGSSVQLTVSDYSSVAELIHLAEGVFYFNGYYIGVNRQTIVGDINRSLDTYNIGLTLEEKIITAKDDPTLYDIALGFNNYSAPGADRYYISLVLTKTTTDSDEAKFIKLMEIVGGAVRYANNKTEYSEINKMLARRLYDHAGDFVINKKINVTSKHMRNNYRGVWTPNQFYMLGDVVTDLTGEQTYYTRSSGYSGSIAPAHLSGGVSDGSLLWNQTDTPYRNGGIINAANSKEQQELHDNQILLRVSPIKAYISGYEVNSPSTDIIVNKTRKTKQEKNRLAASNGITVLVTLINGRIDKPIEQANILDSADVVIGTCFIKSLEFVSGVNDGTGIYRLTLMGVKIDDGKLYSIHAAKIKVSTTFTSNIVLSETLIVGTINAQASTTVQGKGSFFTRDLRVGSVVKIGTVTTTVVTIESDFTFTVTVAVDATESNNLIRISPNITYGASSNLYSLATAPVNKVTNAAGAIDISYTVAWNNNIGSVPGTSCVVLAPTNTYFDSTSSHILFNVTDGGVINPTYTLNGTFSQLTISGLPAGKSWYITTKLNVIGDSSREKTKTLTTKSIIVDSNSIKLASDNSVLSTGYKYSSNEIILTESDVTRIISIKQGNNSVYSDVNAVDITEKYWFENGQRDDIYGPSKIGIITPSTKPTTPIKITFEYFEHSTGDYFSRNSYVNIPNELIPWYNKINLGDMLDFRSRIDDTGLGFDELNGGAVSASLLPSSMITVDYSYFLNRVDVLCLDSAGKLLYIEGEDAKFGELHWPTVPQESLLISKILVSANVMFPDIQVFYQLEKYQRYTMRDINHIDERLSNVEKYVSLSLLEKKTADLQVKDQNGIDRYKNGFFVDTFIDQNLTDVDNPDTRITLDKFDFINSIRPPVSETVINLIEPDGTTQVSRYSDKYRVTGDVASLPYELVPLVEQRIATSHEFVNPYHVIVWEGQMQLIPNKDEWETTETVIKNIHI